MTSDEPLRSDDDLVRDADMLMQSVSSALHDLVGIAQQLDTPEPLLGILYGLRAIKAEISNRDKTGAFDRIEAEVFPIMGERKMLIPPFGEFISHKGMRRTGWRWRPQGDTPGLVDVIVARCADDWTGEPPAVFAAFVADELAACIGFSQGKVKGLTARGLKAGDFCTEEPQGWSLQLPAKVSDDDLGSMGEAA